MFEPRPLQQEVLAYTGGRMGVSAVPGSGKTLTLSYLAAQLIAGGYIREDQEVLIVTLVNSAVNNFSARVATFIEERGLLPHVGYRVRTLHGLAHDIVRERPALVNLANDFQIIDERVADQIIQEAVDAWISSNPEFADEFLSPDLDQNRLSGVRRKQYPDLVQSIAVSFIRTAKDLQLSPGNIRDWLEATHTPLPLVKLGCDVYADYQRALNYRGAVDFDDLIRLALQALRTDPEYLDRLRYTWPYILEDEAQDSSRLQEHILRLLSGESGNWVRVGDPNQAIYETFTTASPLYLKNFIQGPGVISRALPNSGRSTHSIIRLANYLIDWTQAAHPIPELRSALSLPYIEPTPPGDPQPNPPDDPRAIHFFSRKLTPQEELEIVANSLAKWLPQHPLETAAVLVPRNERGVELVEALKNRGVEYVELLRSTRSTRETAGILESVLGYLANPTLPNKLAEVYRVWQRGGDAQNDEAAAKSRREFVARLIRKCPRLEDFLWPALEHDWLADLESEEIEESILAQLAQFRDLVRRWLDAILLPIDQLILTVAQDLFDQPADLAVAHKLAGVLGQANADHPDWRLSDLAQELAVVASNQRKFIGLSDDDTGFDPDRHRGKVVVATMHKAKGLEWDRVYLLSVNGYDFPSGYPADTYISEKYFVRDRLNLEAEALSQLSALAADDPVGYNLAEGLATLQARLDYSAERLRLLYVGITRARKELILTWNTGRNGDQQPALPFIALRTFREEEGVGEQDGG